MGRKHIKDHSQAYSGTLPYGEIKKLRAAVDHSLSGRWQPTASISDFWFLISVFCLLISVLCVLVSGVCSLISAFWYLSSDVCSLSSDFCSLVSVIWFLLSVLCYLFSVLCLLISVFLSHTPLSKKTAHLINKICCPYCQTFSRLRIDSSAFSFSGFCQPLSFL